MSFPMSVFEVMGHTVAESSSSPNRRYPSLPSWFPGACDVGRAVNTRPRKEAWRHCVPVITLRF